MVLFAFLLISTQVSLSAPADTLYVSTIGSKFFVNSTTRFPGYILLRIEEPKEARNAIEFLSASSATGNPRYQTTLKMMMREIDKCDYRKENCYILLSPRTHDLLLAQPFLLHGARKLIFNVGVSPQREGDGYSFTRLLITTKAERDLELIVRTREGDVVPPTYRGSPP